MGRGRHPVVLICAICKLKLRTGSTCPAEEAHATSYGPYATSSAAAAAERGESRFLSGAQVLQEAWSW
jgi:hypothetical protein